jgi:hypothetical protein
MVPESIGALLVYDRQLQYRSSFSLLNNDLPVYDTVCLKLELELKPGGAFGLWLAVRAHTYTPSPSDLAQGAAADSEPGALSLGLCLSCKGRRRNCRTRFVRGVYYYLNF